MAKKTTIKTNTAKAASASAKSLIAPAMKVKTPVVPKLGTKTSTKGAAKPPKGGC